MSMNKEYVKEFLEVYDEVFDENGNVKLCGREKCFQLIKLADKVEKGVSHGNLKTGHMYIEYMHKLRTQL